MAEFGQLWQPQLQNFFKISFVLFAVYGLQGSFWIAEIQSKPPKLKTVTDSAAKKRIKEDQGGHDAVRSDPRMERARFWPLFRLRLRRLRLRPETLPTSTRISPELEPAELCRSGVAAFDRQKDQTDSDAAVTPAGGTPDASADNNVGGDDGVKRHRAV
jgi:hypothetical protein